MTEPEQHANDNKKLVLPPSSRSPVIYKRNYCRSIFTPSEFQRLLNLLKKQRYLKHFSSLFLSKLIYSLKKNNDEQTEPHVFPFSIIF